MYILLTGLVCITALAIVILSAKNIASQKFICKHCSKEFRIKWTKVTITEHSGNEYMLTCPFCNIKDWCTEEQSGK